MKHIILYYSGSGNSLMIARELVVNNEEYELRRITKKMKIDDIAQFETVGIVSPVYFWTVPKTVSEVISKIKNVKYLYVITDYSMCPGNVLKDIKDILSKNRCKINFYASINMPETAVMLGELNSEQETAKRIKKAKDKIQVIKSKIMARENELEDEPKRIKRKVVMATVNAAVAFTKKAKGTNYWVSEACIKCNKCIERCPRNNISLVKGQITWGNDCDECAGCINRCPVQAVQVGKATENKRRYVNSDIKDTKW